MLEFRCRISAVKEVKNNVNWCADFALKLMQFIKRFMGKAEYCAGTKVFFIKIRPKPSKTDPKFQKKTKKNQKPPDASKCVRMHPNASQQVQMDPNMPEKLAKTWKNLAKTSKNFAKFLRKTFFPAQ